MPSPSVTDDQFRLVLFTDPSLPASVSLLAAALREASAKPGVEVAVIVDTMLARPSPLRVPRELAARTVRRVWGSRPGVERAQRPLLTTPRALARQHGVPLLAPRGRGINDPRFVQRVREEIRPHGALALMVSQIFRPPLLEACRAPANYHNGLLPDYRGVGATEWSLYRGERRSGFAYHWMSEAVDEGAILLQDAVSVEPGAVPAAVERQKTALAASRMSEAIDRLVERHPGTEQAGEASFYTRARMAAIRDIDDPSSLSLAELERRIRAFDHIHMTFERDRWQITALRRVTRRGRPDLSFTTADGARMEPARCAHLPVPAYSTYRSLRGLAALRAR